VWKTRKTSVVGAMRIRNTWPEGGKSAKSNKRPRAQKPPKGKGGGLKKAPSFFLESSTQTLESRNIRKR